MRSNKWRRTGKYRNNNFVPRCHLTENVLDYASTSAGSLPTPSNHTPGKFSSESESKLVLTFTETTVLSHGNDIVFYVGHSGLSCGSPTSSQQHAAVVDKGTENSKSAHMAGDLRANTCQQDEGYLQWHDEDL